MSAERGVSIHHADQQSGRPDRRRGDCRRYIFGDWGGRLVGALICIGLVSSISAMTWIGPRVTVAMGEDIHCCALFARKSSNNVPQTAILFQLAVVTYCSWLKRFEAVFEFIQFSLTFCSFYRSRADQAPPDPSGASAPLSCMGLPRYAVLLFGGDAVHDVLPRDEQAGAVAGRLRDHDCRARDLLRVALGDRIRNRSTKHDCHASNGWICCTRRRASPAW